MTTIAVIGAGHIGSQIARALAAAGNDVIVSNAAGPESLAELVREIGPRATAASVTEAAQAGDVVVIAVPLAAFGALPAEALAGKVVLSTTNYNPERDGQVAALTSGSDTVAGLLQAQLPTSRVVKAFSHLSAAEVTTDGTPAGTPGRRALAIAGDDEDAKHLATQLYDAVGFDTVDLGPLSESWKIGMGQPAFVTRQDASELRADVARARRTSTSG